MRFMMMVKSDARAEAGVLPDEKLLTAMGKLNEEMISAGVMLAGEGLQASAKGARVRLAGKSFSVTDGPFAEAKELVAGFWLIQTPSLAEAVAWAKRVPGEDGEIELRQLWELSDFPVDPAEKADGWREWEGKFRDSADDAPAPSATEVAAPAAPPRLPGTTRFMVMLKSDKATESGALPTAKALTEMGDLMQELAASGALLSGEGLKRSAIGARVRTTRGQRVVLDGPFSESKELIAGYSIIQVPSLAEAIEFAKRWLRIHVETGIDLQRGEIEVRQIFELSDFPVTDAETPDGWRQREQALRS
jgi:hypothetical protein